MFAVHVPEKATQHNDPGLWDLEEEGSDALNFCVALQISTWNIFSSYFLKKTVL